MMSRVLRLISVLLLAMLLPAAATGCGPSEAELAKYKTQGDKNLAQGLDPEGYSRDEVFNLTDREQYELFKKRYERAYEVAGDIMTEAVGSDEEWDLTTFGFSPRSGDRGQNPIPRSARPEDTYTFDLSLVITFDEPVDYKAVVEKIQSWMIEQDYNTSDIGDALHGGLQVNGLTQDGIQAWFMVDTDYMSIDVFAGPYWGDPDHLRSLLKSHPQQLQEQYSYVTPYEFMPFPQFLED